MRAIDKVTKQFQTKIGAELKKHHVAEWELDIYFRDVTTLRQEAKIVELASAGKSVEALVETIITKALDQEGKPLFTQADKTALMNEADPAIVLSLSRVLNGGELPDAKEIEKN